LIAETKGTVVKDKAWIGSWSSAFEIIMENRGSPNVPRDREGELSRWIYVSKDHLCNSSAFKIGEYREKGDHKKLVPPNSPG